MEPVVRAGSDRRRVRAESGATEPPQARAASHTDRTIIRGDRGQRSLQDLGKLGKAVITGSELENRWPLVDANPEQTAELERIMRRVGVL